MAPRHAGNSSYFGMFTFGRFSAPPDDHACGAATAAQARPADPGRPCWPRLTVLALACPQPSRGMIARWAHIRPVLVGFQPHPAIMCARRPGSGVRARDAEWELGSDWCAHGSGGVRGPGSGCGGGLRRCARAGVGGGARGLRLLWGRASAGCAVGVRGAAAGSGGYGRLASASFGGCAGLAPAGASAGAAERGDGECPGSGAVAAAGRGWTQAMVRFSDTRA